MSSKSVLGRGLGALLKERKSTEQKEETSPSTYLSLSLIDVDKNQPRKFFSEISLQELSDSIKSYGVIQPITVKKKDNGRYHLISGERRFRASKLAGLESIPVFILSIDDNNILEIALIENLQREDLNAIEIAFTLNSLLEKLDISQDNLAKKIGKDRSTITNYIRLLKLPIEIQNSLSENLLSMGHARALINIESDEKKMELFHDILKNNLSVREVEERVKNLNSPKNQKKKASEEYTKRNNDISKKLREALQMKVKITNNEKGRGEIRISFKSEEELHKIVNFLEK